MPSISSGPLLLPRVAASVEGLDLLLWYGMTCLWWPIHGESLGLLEMLQPAAQHTSVGSVFSKFPHSCSRTMALAYHVSDQARPSVSFQAMPELHMHREKHRTLGAFYNQAVTTVNK